MKLAFTGYYGFENFGDNLFAIICALASRKYWPEISGSVVAPRSSELLDTGIEVPRLFCPHRIYNHASPLGFACRLASMLRCLFNNNLVVFGGGSLFCSGSFTPARRIQEYVCAVGLKRFAALGVSFGPFSSVGDEKRCIEFLKRFEFISTRDRASYEALCSFSLPLEPVMAGDLAGVLPLLLEKRNRTGAEKKVLGVAPCNYLKADMRERHEDIFNAVLAFAFETGCTIRCFVLNGHPSVGDGALAQDLVKRLACKGIPAEIVCVGDGTLHAWHKIASCTWMISARLHGAISAYLNGVPFVMVEYHDKCTDFVCDVGQADALRLPRESQGMGSVSHALAALHDAPRCEVSPSHYSQEALRSFTCVPWRCDA